MLQSVHGTFQDKAEISRETTCATEQYYVEMEHDLLVPDDTLPTVI